MYYAGIDLGGTNISTGIVDANGTIIAKASLKTKSERGAEAIITDMFETVKMACSEAGISVENLQSIGIGVPGTIDGKAGVVVYSNNINWVDVKLFELLSKFTDKPLYAANDANCGAFGEYIAGGAKGYNSAVIITLGTGVGSGIVIEGKILEGFNSAGGEMGHTLLQMNGELCTCGRRGCWEAYASATALKGQTQQLMDIYPDSIMHDIVNEEGEINGKTAFIAAKNGDEAGKMVVENYLLYVAEGIVNVINTFQPNIILIGGGVSHEGEYILEKIRNHAKQYSFGAKYVNNTVIERATLGNDAGIIGAAMLWKNAK